MKKYVFNKSISNTEIQNLRERYNLSKKELAAMVGVSTKTIDRWEQKDQVINGRTAVLLNILMENRELLNKYELPELEYPIRLYYLDGNTVTTVIDVDELNRKVKIRNYTDEIVRRAFGIKTNVTYEDYEAFLESRCFPKERDMLKLELELRGLPFYDTRAIIALTGGRVEGDSYRIEIEKKVSNES